MNDNEKEFEVLRRLLALKRHETPPPGYFDRFPGAIMARLRASQSGMSDTVAERMADRLPWLLRLVRALEAKPAFATTFASALCVLLLTGIVFAERPEGMVQPLIQSAQNSSPLNIASAAKTGLSAEPAGMQVNDFLPGANPVFDPQSMGGTETIRLFGGKDATLQPVVFTFPGN